MSSTAKSIAEIEEKLKDIISSYQDLNEKCDVALERIKTKKTKRTKNRSPMAPKDTRIKPTNVEYDSPITIGELSAILEINQKSIEINLEVEKQNEQVIESLEKSDEKLEKILENQKEIISIQKELKIIANTINNIEDYTSETNKEVKTAISVIDNIEDYTSETNREMKDVVSKKVEKINENILKITILLATAGAGTIFNVIQSLIKK